MSQVMYLKAKLCEVIIFIVVQLIRRRDFFLSYANLDGCFDASSLSIF